MNIKVIVIAIILFVTSCATATASSLNEIKRYEAWRKTEKLVDYLDASSKQDRLAAIESLGKVKDPRAIGPLSEFVTADSWIEREAAAKSLGKFHDALALKPLLKLLKDEEQFVRDAAANSLIETSKFLATKKDLRFYNPVFSGLREDDEFIQKVCAKALRDAVYELRRFNDTDLTKPLVKALDDKHAFVKETAAQLLGEISDPNAISSLLEAQKDSDIIVRETASEALRKYKDERAILPLKEALKDENPAVRNEATIALGEFNDDKSIQILIKALKNKHPRVREGAAKALGEIRDDQAIKPLIPLLKDKHTYVRLAAGEALGTLEWEPQTDEQRAIFCVANKDWDQCIALGKLSYQALIGALKGTDLEVSIEAAETLQTLKWQPENKEDSAYFYVALRQWEKCVPLGKVAIKPISRELNSEDTTIVRSAIKTLGDIKHPAAITYLLHKYATGSAATREAVVNSLANIKDPKSVKAIIIALDDSNNYVREAAQKVLESELDAFKQLNDPDSIKPLIKALKDNNRSVRAIAAKFLGEFQNPEATKYLIEALKDSDIEVRKAASDSLKKIKDPQAIEPLVAALNDPNAEVRVTVVETLGEFRDHRAIEPLMEKLKDPSPEVRIATIKIFGNLNEPRAIDSLVAATSDYDVKVRLAAAEVLGGIKDPRVYIPLIGMLKSESTAIRVAAGSSLTQLNWATSNKEDDGWYCVASRAWDKCRELKKNAVPALIHELKQADSPVKLEVIDLLGEIKDPRAIQPLIETITYTQFVEGRIEKRDLLRYSQKVLKKYGSKAIPQLRPTITDWYTSQYTAKILKKLKWKPRSDVEVVRFQVALRSADELNNNWPLVKSVLLKDVESKNPQIMNNALFAFMGIGNPEVIDDLLLRLNSKGTIALAEAYLNCGNKTLMEAAVTWAIEHSLDVNQYAEGQNPVVWGEFNQKAKK